MKISRHFETEDFGVALHDQDIQNYHLLAMWILDDLFDKYGVVEVTSGARTPEHNSNVGGVPTSQHITDPPKGKWAEACDFYCPYAPNGMGDVYAWIVGDRCWRGQVFWYKKRGHIHIALPRYNIPANRGIFEDK